jgi:di/tricarboxylate transporter
MTMAGGRDHGLAREARLVAVVIAVTMVLWIGLQWLGGRLGWDTSYAFLFDLAALAAFFWALVVTWRIWRRTTRPNGN